MKKLQLLFAGCILTSWTALNAHAVGFDQGITSGDIRHVVKQVRTEAGNDAKNIQPVPVAAQTSVNCLQRSLQSIKKNGVSYPPDTLNKIVDMCAAARSEAVEPSTASRTRICNSLWR